MKKIFLLTVTALSLNFISPLLPAVQAASVADQVLAQVVSQNPSAARVQQLLDIKQNLDRGNKAALWELLAQTAIEQSGRPELAAVASAAQSGDLGTMVKDRLQQEVGQRISSKLGPYQDGLQVIANLLKNSNLDPQASQNNNSLAGAPENYRKMLDMTATAYGPGLKDNGRWNDLTYLGGKVRKGVVAVDPKVIPMGTKLWVEGYGEAVAEDQGSAIKGNRIDLAFNTRQEALDFGVKPVKVYVLN